MGTLKKSCKSCYHYEVCKKWVKCSTTKSYEEIATFAENVKGCDKYVNTSLIFKALEKLFIGEEDE